MAALAPAASPRRADVPLGGSGGIPRVLAQVQQRHGRVQLRLHGALPPGAPQRVAGAGEAHELLDTAVRVAEPLREGSRR
jgi:hypothetical protein